MSSVRLLTQLSRSARGTRTFSSSATRQDLIQNLYIRELKSYKSPVVAKDAHVGSVKVFTSPTAPKPPVLPADLAAELAAYDAAEPTKADVEAVKHTGLSGEEVGGGAEAFLSFLEADVKPAEAHH
ncbi:ATP synthase complex subunit H-domain-containing protein [Boletus edulis BED1]|uniref:ATP synthase complex subunit H-domain-containing protein n=1 Tax=Boletus edulis BED1 TaxID=1328754 RepID=A0AAD4BHD7_BOLED|nr:ATP synthase complex subunit H-domain-containing protein [Boletus edulis BED1]